MGGDRAVEIENQVQTFQRGGRQQNSPASVCGGQKCGKKCCVSTCGRVRRSKEVPDSRPSVETTGPELLGGVGLGREQRAAPLELREERLPTLAGSLADEGKGARRGRRDGEQRGVERTAWADIVLAVEIE